MIPELALLAAVGYLLGSIPFSRLISRRKGVNLERTGSGVPSAANVWHSVGLRSALAAFVADFAKAAIPVALVNAARGAEPAAYLGVFIMIGHNWPLFARFNGGRGMLVVIGTAVIVHPWGLALVAGLLVPVARLIRDTAPPSAVALLLLPLLAFLFGQPPGLILAFAAFASIIFVRRATAPPRVSTWRGLLSKLMFDRPDRHRRWALDASR